MRKKITFWVTLAVMLLSGSVVWPVTAAAYTGIFDTFDSETPGAVPEGWTRSGAVAVSNDFSVSPDNSVKLQGGSGSAVSAYKSIAVAPENAVLEADVYPGEGDAGSLSLIEASGKWQARVLFKDGFISYSDIGHDDQQLHSMTTYTPNSWYHVKILHDHAAKTFDVYVDGTLVGDNLPMYTSGDQTPVKLLISSGNDAGSRLIYFDNIRLYSAADETAPALLGSSVWRSDGDTAMVRFISDEAGTCYYQITGSATPTLDVASGGTNGGLVTAATASTVYLSGLTSGEKYVHIVVEDGAGNVSDPLTISMPCDYYYSENFEAYPLDTYIASNMMSPLAQRNGGTGSLNQKVIQNVSDVSKKMLSLASNHWAASDQHILLDSSILAASNAYVFEGDVYPLLDTGFQLRFSFTDGSYEGNHEAGVFFNGSKITTARQSGAVTLRESYTAGQWHHVKIVATPASSTYAVYVDGELLSDTLPLPPGIDRLAISAGNLADGTTAYYDNLKFYLAPITPDTREPELTGASVWRSDGNTAAVRFASDEAGTCYYLITDSLTSPADVISDGTNGGPVAADTTATVSLSGLTSGEKYVHLVVQDESDNVSDPLTISLPYDYYYYEDFEVYPLNTTIASDDMGPLHQVYEGSGDGNQKVVSKVNGVDARMLSLSSTSGWASGHVVLLNDITLSASEKYVFEGDIYALGTSNKQLRFNFTSNPTEYKNEAGLVFGESGNILSGPLDGNDFIDLGSDYIANQWHHVKLEGYPQTGKYSVYVDGNLIADTLTLPGHISYLALTAMYGNTAYFDNLEFYLVPSIPAVHYPVIFNENYSETPSTETYYIAGDTSDFYDAPTGGVLQTLTAPARTGYVFGGWYKESDCTNQIISDIAAVNANTDYTDSAALWTKNEGVTLYAKWQEATPSGLSLDYENEQVAGLTANADYRISGVDVTADANGKTGIQSGWFGTDIVIIKKGVVENSSFDSGEATVVVPMRPTAPTGIGTVDETAAGAGDGKITGVSETMEYKYSSASSWTAVSPGATEINGLDDGDYLVRKKAVTSGNIYFASVEADITVGTRSGYGSSGGSSSARTVPPTYSADIIAGSGTEKTLPVTVDGNEGIAAVDAGSGKLTSSGTVVTMPRVPNVNTYSVGIPVTDLSTTGIQGTLTLNTGAGSVTVPSNMLTDITGAGGDKAQIAISEGYKASLPEDVKAAIGDKPLISLTLSIDGKQTDWSNPGAPVTVSIPYAPTTAELKNPESIVVWYIDGSGNVAAIPNGHYDTATAMVIFSTTHFSDYAVAYNMICFNDVALKAWYADAVNFVAAREITTGTGKGSFSPHSLLTRGQFVVLLMNAYGISPDDGEEVTTNFADAGSTYYTNYLLEAKSLGVVKGIGSNMFAPEKAISRQEMFVMLYNALEVMGQLPQASGDNQLSNFEDADQVVYWAQEAMSALIESGVVSGNNDMLTPDASTTRAEMAQMLYKLLMI